MTILLCYKSPQYLTAAALLDRSIWRERGGFVSKWCQWPQGPLIKVYGVSIYAYCHGGFNETIGGRVGWPCPAAGDTTDLVKSSFGGLRGLWSGSLRCLWMHLFKPVPMILPAAMSDIGGRIYHRLFTAAALSACTYVITWVCSHWPLHVGRRGVMETCRFLTAAALSSRSDVIRIVFSLPMSSSLVPPSLLISSQGQNFITPAANFFWSSAKFILKDIKKI